ncbi:DUF1015 family protein [Nocardioides cheoyonin]|uniref:DUF1015 family protein n=1 Tax=Nocardioides cheoyonin TaxID=3156615 RepID=UPI0032B35C83
MDDSAVVIPPYVSGPLRLEPFRALRLNPARVGDPASARLYARPYRGVAARLTSWLERGDLVEDAAPALYVHEYTEAGLTVRGVVGALDVSRRATCVEDAAVLPHEGIHPKQADELADRMQEMALNPAPILLLQDYPQAARDALSAVIEREPDQAFRDRGDQHHRIWAVHEPSTVAALNTAWQPTRALIADGHHRYAAYLRVQARCPGGPADHGLAMLVDQGATPLHLGAIHRVLQGVTLDDLRQAAHALDLPWKDGDREAALATLDPSTLVVGDGSSWASVLLPAHARSAVDYLHDTLVPALRRGPTRVRHHHSVEDTMRHVRRGRDTAVLLPAPTPTQIWRTVLAGRLLPEKATSFQPKPHPGVLIRTLRA